MLFELAQAVSRSPATHAGVDEEEGEVAKWGAEGASGGLMHPPPSLINTDELWTREVPARDPPAHDASEQ